MNTRDIQINLVDIRTELRRGIRECSERRLLQTTKWLSELNFTLKDIKIPDEDVDTEPQAEIEDHEAHTLAMSYFDCQEFDRAAHILENCLVPRSVFLYRYSQYMACEKRRLDNLTDTANDSADTSKAQVLLDHLSYFKANSNCLDGYLLYLYGVVLSALDLHEEAIQILSSCVRKVPYLWAAWLELAKLMNGPDQIKALDVPRTWMYLFFTGQAFTQLKYTEQALEIYAMLKNNGFEKSTYVIAQLAITFHDKRDVDAAFQQFKELLELDPYRLEDWDIYSHLLYLQERKTELANLAQRALQIDKFRVETCCVIGNYYSLRSEHQKAVIYFQRALFLDPQYLTAWILMGHEFIELQNSNAAIQCYRQAIEVNRNDYRAWNGLGQAYEILGLNSYCVYYYSRAAKLRPDDSRMLVALGEAYERMDKIANALKCYYRAHSQGDIEGMALFRMAKLYDRVRMQNSAAVAYLAAVNEPSNAGSHEIPAAYRFLANYYVLIKDFDHAEHFAYKCLDYESTKEDGKSILKSISEWRASEEASIDEN